MTLLTRCTGALLDLVTGAACIMMWVGSWSLFDAGEVHELTSGIGAVAVAFLLAVAGAHHWLERLAARLPFFAVAIMVWLWVTLLILLSILIWRVGFHYVEDPWVLPPGDNLRCALVLLVGIVASLLGGRLRSASDAAPVGFSKDDYRTSGRFVPALFSSHAGVLAVLLDLVLTPPVIFVWSGLWVLEDNLGIPHLPSVIVCAAIISLIGVTHLDRHLRAACAGLWWPLVFAADLLYTLLFAVLCITIWRGVWDGLEQVLGNGALKEYPLRALALAIVGIFVLNLLQRYRSAMFEPMNYSVDVGPAFKPTGVHHYVYPHGHPEDAQAGVTSAGSGPSVDAPGRTPKYGSV